MTENRENWLYPEASGLYFPHDGFVMRALDGKQYDIEEECELLNELNDENEQSKMMIATLRNIVLENENLEKENDELKARNYIQYKRLGHVYELIEKQDWASLTAIVEDLKQAEEQLQEEWGTYRSYIKLFRSDLNE